MEYGEPTPNLFVTRCRTGKTPMLYNLAEVLRDLTLLSRITHWTCFESYACRNVYGILWIDF